MKIVIIGGTGTIGRAVLKVLQPGNTVIVAGHTQGDIQVDISDVASMERMYQSIEDIDAVVSTTGKVHFGELTAMSTQEYYIGLDNKLMGQVNLVLLGLKYLKPGASFTLTSGILNIDPIRYGSSAAMVNGALEGFVKSAAIEMPKGMRVNLVSPTVITESMPMYESYFPGFTSVPAAEAALAYRKSVLGHQNGQVYRVGYV